jgi:DNA ligase-1
MSFITAPMLASPLEADDVPQFPVLATPKLDGIRCLVVLLGGVKTAVSRNWKPIRNAFIRRHLEEVCPVGFDGEIMLRGSMDFQKVSSAVMSSDGEPDFEYWVFDYVKESLTTPYNVRLSHLRMAHANSPSLHSRVVVVDATTIMDQSALDVYEEWALKEGYEGVMIRTPSSPYKLGRSSVKQGYLLKVKRFTDGEAVILEVKAKKHNTNEIKQDELGRNRRSSAKAGIEFEERVGGFVVKDLVTGIQFNIGSGLNEVEGHGLNRDDLWAKRASLPGKIIKYKSQPTGVKEAPRFPIILGFRDKADMSK